MAIKASNQISILDVTDGADGRSVSSITPEYYLSTSNTSATGGSWSTKIPTWESGKYLWIRYKINYTNPSGTGYSSEVCDNSLNAMVAKGTLTDELNAELRIDGNSITVRAGDLIIDSDHLSLDANGNLTINTTGLTLDSSGNAEFIGDVKANNIIIDNGLKMKFSFGNDGSASPNWAYTRVMYLTGSDTDDLALHLELNNNDLLSFYGLESLVSTGNFWDFGSPGGIEVSENVNIYGDHPALSFRTTPILEYHELTSDYPVIANKGWSFGSNISVSGDIAVGTGSSNKSINVNGSITATDTISTNDLLINHKNIFDLIYPVGSIYMSVNNVNPSTLFGGTWVEWGSGRVPVGVNTSDSNFNTVEKTGGSSSVKLTANQIPSHTHDQYSINTADNPKGGTAMYSLTSEAGTTVGFKNTKTQKNNIKTGSTGGGASHTNLQPYITCYMWKRTA